METRKSNFIKGNEGLAAKSLFRINRGKELDIKS